MMNNHLQYWLGSQVLRLTQKQLLRCKHKDQNHIHVSVFQNHKFGCNKEKSWSICTYKLHSSLPLKKIVPNINSLNSSKSTISNWSLKHTRAQCQGHTSANYLWPPLHVVPDPFPSQYNIINLHNDKPIL